MPVIDAFRAAVDVDQGVATLSLYGTLSPAAAPLALAGLAKCLAEQPAAVVLDLLGTDAGREIVPLLLLIRREVRRDPPARLVIVADPSLRRVLRRNGIGAEIVADGAHVGAIAAALARPEHWRQVRLPRGPAAAALAGDLVTDACAGWRLAHLLSRARWVAFELAENAVRHAGTDVVMTLTRRRHCMALQFRDGSVALPRLLEPAADDPNGLCWHGFGLHTVNELSTAWGVHPMPAGKIVWATFALAVRGAGRRSEP